MITLPHTGMRVPNDRIRVTSLKEVDTGDGVAWSAVLRLDQNKLGTLMDAGQGGATLFRPVNGTARKVMAAFVALCRDRDGKSMAEEFVFDALAEEYEWARDVAEADRKGRYLVRHFTRIDIPGSLSFALEHTAPPDYDSGLQATAHMGLPDDAVRAELWMGDRGWTEFYRTADTAE
jgi:hypothetical protein